MKYLFLLVLLTGCATTWVKPGATQASFTKDQMGCTQYARQDAVLAGLQGNMMVDVYVNNRVTDCMLQLGYTIQRTK